MIIVSYIQIYACGVLFLLLIVSVLYFVAVNRLSPL